MRRSRLSALAAPAEGFLKELPRGSVALLVDPPGHLLGHVGVGNGEPDIPVRLLPGDDPTKVTARQIVDAINRVRPGTARLVSDSRIETSGFVFGSG